MILRVGDRNFGSLVRSTRESTIDPTTGRPYTQARVAELVADLSGEPVSRSLVAGWESDEIELPRIKHLNALPKVLPVSVEDLVRALGLEFESAPMREKERRMQRAFRRLSRTPILEDTALRVVEAMAQPPQETEYKPRRRGQIHRVAEG